MVAKRIGLVVLLYVVCLSFVGYYLYEVLSVYQTISSDMNTVFVQTNMFIFLLPISFVTFHVVWLLSHKLKVVQRLIDSNAGYTLLFFLGFFLVFGFCVERYIVLKITSSGFIECKDERSDGLRSSRIVYKLKELECT